METDFKGQLISMLCDYTDKKHDDLPKMLCTWAVKELGEYDA
jgi:hypothetical protein